MLRHQVATILSAFNQQIKKRYRFMLRSKLKIEEKFHNVLIFQLKYEIFTIRTVTIFTISAEARFILLEVLQRKDHTPMLHV